MDRLGSYKARWGIGRMNYTVDPGLYALGNPGPDSRVFVSANYKMSFDILRHSLAGFDAWILVLDTKGINVWCAAGKGTFGTEELLYRIETSGLSNLVSHKELILPQLGAPGVAAHEVKARSGFHVVYGPVCAADLPAFLRNGLKATRKMRIKTFDMLERLVLVPMELIPALKVALIVLAALALISFLISGFSWSRATDCTVVALFGLGAAILAGAVLTPLLLPWLPGKAFSLKGCAAGILVMGLLLLIGTGHYHFTKIGLWAILVSCPAMAAYLAMNFTGSSTYTSLSGVRKEMKWSLPLQIVGTAAALVLWVISAAGKG